MWTHSYQFWNKEQLSPHDCCWICSQKTNPLLWIPTNPLVTRNQSWWSTKDTIWVHYRCHKIKSLATQFPTDILAGYSKAPFDSIFFTHFCREYSNGSIFWGLVWIGQSSPHSTADFYPNSLRIVNKTCTFFGPLNEIKVCQTICHFVNGQRSILVCSFSKRSGWCVASFSSPLR